MSLGALYPFEPARHAIPFVEWRSYLAFQVLVPHDYAPRLHRWPSAVGHDGHDGHGAEFDGHNSGSEDAVYR